MGRVTLGRIGAPYGVHGWVRVQSETRPPESILDFDRWWVETRDGERELAVLESRQLPRGIAVRLQGCEDRDAAARLRHAAVSVPVERLPEPGAGEWYWHELIGLRVETVDGTALGRVDHLLETGANDVLVVRGERERLIPWIPDAVIRSIDPDAGRMVVDWDPEF